MLVNKAVFDDHNKNHPLLLKYPTIFFPFIYQVQSNFSWFQKNYKINYLFFVIENLFIFRIW